jgi:hypothetical protein
MGCTIFTFMTQRDSYGARHAIVLYALNVALVILHGMTSSNPALETDADLKEAGKVNEYE